MSDVESDPVEFLAGDLPSPEVEMATLGANVGPAADMAIEDINPANPHLFKNDCWQDHFARLRAEDPVHLNELETSGRYWSLTKYDDVRATDGNWETFSSAGGISLGLRPGPANDELLERLQTFIAMDPPKHTEQRKTVRGVSAPSNLRNLEPMIRERTAQRPGLAARGGDVRLGRHRVHRADDAHAGDAVRLPDGGPAHAHPLVRHRLRRARARAASSRASSRSSRRSSSACTTSRACGTSVVASTGRTSSRCSPTVRPPRTWLRWTIWATCCC